MKILQTIDTHLAVIAVTFLSLFAVSLVPALTTHAADLKNSKNPVQNGVCNGVISSGTNDCQDTTNTGIDSVVKSALTILSFLIGAVSVVMIIIGGFRYIVSGGDSGQLGNAKNTIIYAVVGLIIVLFAQIIVHFVIGNVSTAANKNS
ncbi:MAG TPA: pilin [Candidatus Saccharimonadales bacterium]|nr:pilin [Candidatus Saccharimonadales bacterium]